MKKFVELWRREQGLTLIELIAAITLSALVIGVISAVTLFGVRSYHQISIENSLRDEGDIIMSSIITELYSFGPDSIGNLPDGSGIALSGTADGADAMHKIAIEEGQLVIGTMDAEGSGDSLTATQADLSGSGIIFTGAAGLCLSTDVCSTGLVDINLVLVREYGGREYKMELDSKFGF